MVNEELEKLSEKIQGKHTKAHLHILAMFGVCGFVNYNHFSLVRYELEDINVSYLIKDDKLIWLLNFNPVIVSLFIP